MFVSDQKKNPNLHVYEKNSITLQLPLSHYLIIKNVPDWMEKEALGFLVDHPDCLTMVKSEEVGLY